MIASIAAYVYARTDKFCRPVLIKDAVNRQQLILARDIKFCPTLIDVSFI